MKFSLVLLSATFLATIAVAKVDYPISAPVERFNNILDQMDQISATALSYDDFDSKVDYLDYSGMRELATRLQNILRIYDGKPAFSVLKPYYEPVKEMEDLISHVRDLKYFAEVAGGTEETQQKYQQLLKTELVKYQTFIDKSGLFDKDFSFTKKLRSDLNNIKWPSLDQDRNLLLKQMASRLKKTSEKEYDLTKMEEGVHELKRDTRRIFYISNALSNIISPDYEMSCPIGQPVTETPLVPVTEYACHVSSCLTDKLSEAQSELDYLKMQGIQNELVGLPVDQQVIDQATSIYKELKSSQILLHLRAQILNCRSPEEN